MNEHPSLFDAFHELERRADAATDARPYTVPTPRHRSHVAVVAGTVVAVAGLATATALIASRGDDGPSRAQAGGTAPGTSAVATSEPPPIPTSTAPASTAASGGFVLPGDPVELAARFRTVLDGAATFDVTDPVDAPGDPAIKGTLTAGGATGGYDMQILQGTGDVTNPGCEDPDIATCTTKHIDGGILVLGHEPLEGPPNGVTFSADYVRADGFEFIMHISNETDPKGDSTVTAATPPLTPEQLTQIVTSDRW
jgi:hypothetical protein